MEYAPILISVYNRLDHFKNCIESLRKNDLALETHLFVAIDAPYRNEDVSVNTEIVNYANKIDGFKKVTIFQREKNLGIRKNLTKAREDIYTQYDRLIFSEDDNIFTEDFLMFINKGLDAYENREDILTVSGYNYPAKLPETYGKDVYLWKGMSAWGYGTWKEKWNKIEWDEDRAVEEVRKFLKRPTQVFQLSRIANHYLPALLKMEKVNKLHGDGYLCMYQYLNEMYSVFPVLTRVRNSGHDGSGLNSKVKIDGALVNQHLPAITKEVFMPEHLVENDKINKKLASYFRRGMAKRVAVYILLGFYIVGLKNFCYKLMDSFYSINS